MSSFLILSILLQQKINTLTSAACSCCCFLSLPQCHCLSNRHLSFFPKLTFFSFLLPFIPTSFRETADVHSRKQTCVTLATRCDISTSSSLFRKFPLSTKTTPVLLHLSHSAISNFGDWLMKSVFVSQSEQENHRCAHHAREKKKAS